VLSENVSGINDPKFGGVWQDFQERLQRLGYVTGKDVVCASNFGIPQFRKRSILMAVRKDVYFEQKRGAKIVVPTADPEARRRTVRGALSRLPPIGPGERHPTIVNHRTRGMSALNRKRLRAAPPGMSNAYMANTKSGDLSLGCHRRVNAKMKTRCFSDVYTRMHPDRPSPTITTKCHSVSNGRFGHYDPKQVRGISLQEAAILQSFRSDYVFYPTDQVEPVARMIGNAVPPRLAAFFARRLIASVRRPHAGA
jgi:DNA (cytosine-5)-methyltransferase 1